MKTILTEIIRERTDAFIVLEERKSKIIFLNPKRLLFYEVKVDGDLYPKTNTNIRRCDYLEWSNQRAEALYVELKGIDVSSAYEQLLSSVREISLENIAKRTAIVVTPHIPKANLKFQKYMKLCKKHGATLLVVNSGRKFPLY